MDDSSTSFDIPDELPVLPLRDMVVFPYMVLPLFVARERSIAAIEDAMAGDRLLMVVAQRDGSTEVPEPDDLYRVGTVVMVMRILRMADGRVKVLVQGMARATIDSFVEHETSSWVRLTPKEEEDDAEWCVEAEALVRAVRGHVEELLPLKNLPPEVLSITANVNEPGRLADLVASNLKLQLSEAQEILEIVDPLVRLRRVDAVLRRELEVTSVQAEIQSQAHDEMSRNQREHFLREQLRAIQEELGDADPRVEEVEDYRAKIEEVGMDEEALEESMRQLRRLERMHPEGPESQVVRSYLDWMVELPWSNASPDQLDLTNAHAILDEDHAHLTEIKDRILEFLGVRKLRGDSRGPILCFVGPPGVGKTSLGRSIARAMGREFHRISLGGMRDEAEIRGHRRTYVGSMPGRIIQGLKQAGTNNPVMMLDEIDKLGADYRGDPSAALLEVLDSAQNSKFSDHYLNVPFDLSKVLFIATANSLSTIPPALLDRMEVIELSGYTEREKLAISRQYLVGKQLKDHGLTSERVVIRDGALEKVVLEYTNEAGVRNLERHIATLMRKVAHRIASDPDIEEQIEIDTAFVSESLGAPPHMHERAERGAVSGTAVGLAVTSHGGEILFVEARRIAGGKGVRLRLTGQLGDVMRESAEAALSWVRAHASEIGLSDDALEACEIHLHLPAGAVPKDGPSAGIAMITAIVSALSDRLSLGTIAMTGEISLRGRILPVGGIKGKLLAASRAGIETVVIPKRNEKDLAEVPEEVRNGLGIHLVETIDEALALTLTGQDLISPATSA